MIVAYDINGIRLNLIRERERCTVRFIFDSTDPAAVQLVFGDMRPGSLDVSRDVLLSAVFSGMRVGGGRFAVENAYDSFSGQVVLVHLRDTVDGEQECTHILFSRRSVESFLNTTLELIAPSAETYDIDSVIERILS